MGTVLSVWAQLPRLAWAKDKISATLRSPRENKAWIYAHRGISEFMCKLATFFNSFLIFLIFDFSTRISSMAAHWKGVNGLGTKLFRLTVIWPIFLRARLDFKNRCLIFLTSWMMASTSEAVSVGRPTIKYNFKFGMPCSTSAVAASRMFCSVSPLLITRRKRSDPTSGAMVAVLTLLCLSAVSNSGVSRSARSELNEILTSLSWNCPHNFSIPGRSETAAPTSPMRSVKHAP